MCDENVWQVAPILHIIIQFSYMRLYSGVVLKWPLAQFDLIQQATTMQHTTMMTIAVNRTSSSIAGEMHGRPAKEGKRSKVHFILFTIYKAI